MDAEALKELINSLKEDILASVKEEMSTTLKEVDRKNAGVASSLSKEIKKLSKPNPEYTSDSDDDEVANLKAEIDRLKSDNKSTKNSGDSAAIKALRKELEQMRLENQRKEEELARKTRDQQIQSIFSNNKVTHADKALKAFMLENSEKLKLEDGNWYLADGDDVVSLEKAATNFLQSDFGSMFVQPTKGRGLGLTKPSSPTPTQKQELTLNEMLFMDENT